MTERFPGPTVSEPQPPEPDPRVTVGWFTHPDIPGSDIDPECGHRWHDHGWIDSSTLTEAEVPWSTVTWAHGLTVCPAPAGPFNRDNEAILPRDEESRVLRDEEGGIITRVENFSLADARVGDVIEATRTTTEVITGTVTDVLADGDVLTSKGRFTDVLSDDETVTFRLIERNPEAEAVDVLRRAVLAGCTTVQFGDWEKMYQTLVDEGWTLSREREL